MRDSRFFSLCHFHDARVADLAGKVRVKANVKLPDAILAASTLAKNAYAIVTHDEELGKVSMFIKVISAEELIRIGRL